MFKKAITVILLAAFLAGVIITYSTSAKTANKNSSTLKQKELVKNIDTLAKNLNSLDKEIPRVSCAFEMPDEKKYEAQVVAVRKKLKVNSYEDFRVKVYIKNTGNMTWFSADSGCNGPIINLGTDREKNHSSILYSPNISKPDNNWQRDNRIKMDQKRVDPGYIASFTFWANANGESDLYKEFFTPVIDGVGWLDQAIVEMNFIIGETGVNHSDIIKKFLYAGESGSVKELDLNGEKQIAIDLSDQTMTVTLNNVKIRDFKVSTGAPKTPTPAGNYSVLLKQEVRIGGKPPHYVMPKFLMFRKEGYGIHALPSLSRKGRDTFWTEARSHIGRPVSHGCVRLLPEDAEFLYNFADIGTKVVIQR